MIADMANAYRVLEAFTALKKAELDGIGFMHGQAVANEALGDLGDTDEWVRGRARPGMVQGKQVEQGKRARQAGVGG